MGAPVGRLRVAQPLAPLHHAILFVGGERLVIVGVEADKVGAHADQLIGKRPVVNGVPGRGAVEEIIPGQHAAHGEHGFAHDRTDRQFAGQLLGLRFAAEEEAEAGLAQHSINGVDRAFGLLSGGHNHALAGNGFVGQ